MHTYVVMSVFTAFLWYNYACLKCAFFVHAFRKVSGKYSEKKILHGLGTTQKSQYKNNTPILPSNSAQMNKPCKKERDLYFKCSKSKSFTAGKLTGITRPLHSALANRFKLRI